MSDDYYEILQVHPKADHAAIEAAYRRLMDQYALERLSGAAPELVELARQKRAAIEAAYATLGDAKKRAAYDEDRRPTTEDQRRKTKDQRTVARAPADASGDSIGPSSSVLGPAAADALDYRPLPPATRQERPKGFQDQPTTARGEAVSSRTPPGFAALVVTAVVLLPALVFGFALTGGGAATPAVATPTPAPEDQFEAAISQARAQAEQTPENPQAWIDYANLLYDSAQIVREQAPESVLYQQRLPRWLDAANAYQRALDLDPSNAAVRGDKGATACFYGAGAGDEAYLAQGLADTSAALGSDPDNPRVLISHGYCLVYARPPRTDEAIAGWRRVLELAPSDSQVAGQAQLLIEQYSQQ